MSSPSRVEYCDCPDGPVVDLDDSGCRRCGRVVNFVERLRLSIGDELTVTLGVNELALVMGAVRVELRHLAKNRAATIRKFADEADTSRADARIVLLESAYRKMGGDPARITNRRRS